MDKNTKQVEQYLERVRAPRCPSDSHRQRLRQQVLAAIERRQVASKRGGIRRMAAVIALLGTGAAAAAVGMKIQQYHVVGKVPGQGYVTQSENGQDPITIGAGPETTAEQAAKYAQELALLKQQGKGELVGAVELAVNGQHDGRVLSYEYHLSDGQTRWMGERDPDDSGPGTLLTEPLDHLRPALAKARIVATYDRTVQGRPFSFKARRLNLSDGRQVLWAEGSPKEREKPPGLADEGFWRLELSLDMPNLTPGALQLAVFNEDPLAEFVQRLERNRGTRAALVNAAPAQQRDRVRDTQISVVWNLTFRKITGDEVYLLTLVPQGSLQLSANTPAGKKWIATKVVMINQRPCCWCLPVQTKRGKEIPLVLNGENVLDLTGVYDSIVNQPPDPQ
ncbi:MAG: hypothetical protein M1376_10510 [Planctomycetes bacterium]|nr:hypothetical protein [Planctomycetota bacterium]